MRMLTGATYLPRDVEEFVVDALPPLPLLLLRPIPRLLGLLRPLLVPCRLPRDAQLPLRLFVRRSYHLQDGVLVLNRLRIQIRAK